MCCFELSTGMSHVSAEGESDGAASPEKMFSRICALSIGTALNNRIAGVSPEPPLRDEYFAHFDGPDKPKSWDVAGLRADIQVLETRLRSYTTKTTATGSGSAAALPANSKSSGRGRARSTSSTSAGAGGGGGGRRSGNCGSDHTLAHVLSGGCSGGGVGGDIAPKRPRRPRASPLVAKLPNVHLALIMEFLPARELALCRRMNRAWMAAGDVAVRARGYNDENDGLRCEYIMRQLFRVGPHDLRSAMMHSVKGTGNFVLRGDCVEIVVDKASDFFFPTDDELSCVSRRSSLRSSPFIRSRRVFVLRFRSRSACLSLT